MASYTISYFPVMILTVGILFLIHLMITAEFQNVLNLFIENNFSISKQTVDASKFPVMILMGSPVILLIAISVWAIVRGMGGSE